MPKLLDRMTDGTSYDDYQHKTVKSDVVLAHHGRAAAVVVWAHCCSVQHCQSKCTAASELLLLHPDVQLRTQ